MGTTRLVADVGVNEIRELVGPSWPELARMLPALGAPDHSDRPEQAAQARLFELLLGMLGRLGEQAPLVRVVEGWTGDRDAPVAVAGRSGRRGGRRGRLRARPCCRLTVIRLRPLASCLSYAATAKGTRTGSGRGVIPVQALPRVGEARGGSR